MGEPFRAAKIARHMLERCEYDSGKDLIGAPHRAGAGNAA
jgi:hypothetical protein